MKQTILVAVILTGIVISGVSCDAITGASMETMTTTNDSPSVTWKQETDLQEHSFLLDGTIVEVIAPVSMIIKDVAIEDGTCPRRYVTIINKLPVRLDEGDPCLVVSGLLRNESPDCFYIAMWTTGYDKKGNPVSRTLDAAHIIGQIGLYVEQDETESFLMHLNPSDDITLIEIQARAYDKPLP